MQLLNPPFLVVLHGEFSLEALSIAANGRDGHGTAGLEVGQLQSCPASVPSVRMRSHFSA